MLVDPDATQRADPLSRRQLVRVAVAAGIGSVIEWYDFLLYGTAASLYIGPLFFPVKDPIGSALAGFATFFVGFIGRPVGAALFGHYGDRVGRKATLVATLMVMGISTFLIGLVPTYARIGIVGAVIVVCLRSIQGVGIGGEWAGSVLLTMEWGSRERKGLLASIPQAGSGIGLALGILAVQGCTAILGPTNYWTWRLPFLFSIVLILVGLYMRLGILESPVFTRLLEERRIERRPLVTLARTSARDVCMVWFARTSQLVAYYIFTNFVLIYAVKFVGFKQAEVFLWTTIVSFLQAADIVFWGFISDRVGRKRLITIGMVALILFSVPYFLLLDTRVAGLAFLAILVSYIVLDLQFSPFAALIAETFTGSIRYSGASLGFHLGSLTGGVTPFIALALFQSSKTSLTVAMFMAGAGLFSLAAGAFLRDRSGELLSREYSRPVPAG